MKSKDTEEIYVHHHLSKEKRPEMQPPGVICTTCPAAIFYYTIGKNGCYCPRLNREVGYTMEMCSQHEIELIKYRSTLQ